MPQSSAAVGCRDFEFKNALGRVSAPKFGGQRVRAPCILIGPSAADKQWECLLGPDDDALQIAFAKAGFVVVAFDMGNAANTPDSSQPRDILQSGLLATNNVAAALDFVQIELNSVDTLQIYIIGKGTAGTVGMMYTMNTLEFKGCVAFEPVTESREFVLSPDGKTLVSWGRPKGVDVAGIWSVEKNKRVGDLANDCCARGALRAPGL